MRPIEEHSVRLGHLVSSHEAELAALLWGLKRAADLHLPRLRVRNDNVHVMQALGRALVETSFKPTTELSALVSIATSFESIQFRWAKSIHAIQRGDGAHSADFLARQACGLGKRSR
jgi:ribonuclease HI